MIKSFLLSQNFLPNICTKGAETGDPMPVSCNLLLPLDSLVHARRKHLVFFLSANPGCVKPWFCSFLFPYEILIAWNKSRKLSYTEDEAWSTLLKHRSETILSIRNAWTAKDMAHGEDKTVPSPQRNIVRWLDLRRYSNLQKLGILHMFMLPPLWLQICPLYP